MRPLLPLYLIFLALFSDYLPRDLSYPFTVLSILLLQLGVSFVLRRALLYVLRYQGWMSEPRGKMSLKSKVWAFLLKYVFQMASYAKSRRTYAYEEYLPKQKVPTVAQTVQRLLPALFSLDEAKTKRLADQFIKSPEAAKLQAMVLDQETKNDHYVTPWWLQFAYLAQRESIYINSNYYGIFDGGKPLTNRQSSRAAFLVHGFLEVKAMIDEEGMPPTLIPGPGVPLCMEQYKMAFSTTRIPGDPLDQLAHYPSSRHIAVWCQGAWFKVECCTEAGKPLDVKAIEIALDSLLLRGWGQKDQCIAALTTLDRAEWTKYREKLKASSAANARSLSSIETAIFTLVLESHDLGPNPDFTAQAKVFHFGGNKGINRWVDKNFNIIVLPSGHGGMHTEHSWGDAPTIGHILEYVRAKEFREKNVYDAVTGKVVSSVSSGGGAAAVVQELAFTLDEEFTDTIIPRAVSCAANLCDELKIHVLDFPTFGKQRIAKVVKVGPDAFVQMALQLAVYRDTNGEMWNTYESAMTRMFRSGRTETIRSLTADAKAFVENPTLSSLRTACETHQELTQKAMLGKGVDRHLFALRIAAYLTGTQHPFLDDVVKPASQWRLSTSQIPQRQTEDLYPDNDQGDKYPWPSGGFGPITPDGYGVCYNMVGASRIIFHVTSRRSCSATDAERFAGRINKAMMDLMELAK